MELTPIRIRQKRRRRGETLPASTDASQGDQVKAHKDKKRKKKKKQKTARELAAARASYFEKEVPLEVLERIFWFSENINLPLSSLRFGWLLSSRSTLRETLIGAFGPTWDKWNQFIALSSEYRSRPLDYPGKEQEGATWGGNPNFQSALLAQPWADVSMILDSEESWRNRFARDVEFIPARPWTGAKSSSPVLDDEEAPFSGQKRAISSLIRQDFNSNYKAFSQVDTTPAAFPEIPKLDQEETYVRVHRDMRIPDDLLTGPWEDDALVKKLFWLVRAGCLLAEDQTWEVTLQGFRTALCHFDKTGGAAQEIKLRVILLLYILGALKHWPQHVMNDVVNDEIPARIEALAQDESPHALDLRAKYAYIMELLDPLLVTRLMSKKSTRSRRVR